MPKLVFHLEVPVTFSHLCFDIPSSFGNSIFVISTQASVFCMLTAKLGSGRPCLDAPPRHQPVVNLP
jgi:hypothetical protein